MVTAQQIQESRKKILFEKMCFDYNGRTNGLNAFVRDYARSLNNQFMDFTFKQIKIANNGFKGKTLDGQLQHISNIKKEIRRIADLDNPNHPHIGVAKELAKETYCGLMEIYNPILEKSKFY